MGNCYLIGDYNAVTKVEYNIGSAKKLRLSDGDMITTSSFGMIRSTGEESEGTSP